VRQLFTPPPIRIAQEDVFGPAMSAITNTDLGEAVAIADGVDYGLAASIWTRDAAAALALPSGWRPATSGQRLVSALSGHALQRTSGRTTAGSVTESNGSPCPGHLS
jgi:hypothetical protein